MGEIDREHLDDLVCNFSWLEAPEQQYVKAQMERIMLDANATRYDCSMVSKYLYDQEVDRFVEWGDKVLRKYPHDFRTNLLLGCHMFDERLWSAARSHFEVLRGRLQETSTCWHAKVLELVAACEVHQGEERPTLAVFWGFYNSLGVDESFGTHELHQALQEHSFHTAYEAMIFEALEREMGEGITSEES